MAFLDDVLSGLDSLGNDAGSWFSSLGGKLSDPQFQKELLGAVPAIMGAAELRNGPYAEAMKGSQQLLGDFDNGRLSTANQNIVNAYEASADQRARQQAYAHGLGNSTSALTSENMANAQGALLASKLMDQQATQGLDLAARGQSFANNGNGLTNQNTIGSLIGKIFGDGQDASDQDTAAQAQAQNAGLSGQSFAVNQPQPTDTFGTGLAGFAPAQGAAPPAGGTSTLGRIAQGLSGVGQLAQALSGGSSGGGGNFDLGTGGSLSQALAGLGNL